MEKFTTYMLMMARTHFMVCSRVWECSSVKQTPCASYYEQSSCYHVHFTGGHRGFSKVIWTVKEHVSGGDTPHITLYYHSFDGEQGKNDANVIIQFTLGLSLLS
jgi:hypothetical protein